MPEPIPEPVSLIATLAHERFATFLELRRVAVADEVADFVATLFGTVAQTAYHAGYTFGRTHVELPPSLTETAFAKFQKSW